MPKVFIDVREPYEFADSHIDDAINLPLSVLLDDIHKLEVYPKDTQFVLYCRTGNRSNVAMQVLSDKGYTNLVNGINQKQITNRHL